jgi:DNA-directed RNA polymerase specialized sigma24 family protein
MARRQRISCVNSSLPATEHATKERIRESIHRLWFSIQRHIGKSDATGSPSDYADRVEDRVAKSLNGNAGRADVDDEVRDAFRDVVHNDSRTRARQQSRFDNSNPSVVESIPDPNSCGFALTIEEDSHVEWHIEEIRRRVDPEMMTILEQLYGFHSEQWTMDNLAKKMGIKRNTLEKRLSRTFAKLRRELPDRRMNGSAK